VEAYREACSRNAPALIEVRTDRENNVAVHRRLLAALSAELHG
jgi:2-succinyl-5-enolpyruvyl-6-hydroxy-3-cyclohexene-1-carboxylate synthase